MMNTEDQLQQMLRRQADRFDDLPGAGSDFGQVRARARGIRRRRRQRAAGLVAAAVVVVTVPTAVLLHPGGTTVPTPSHHGTPLPSPSPSPSPTHAPHRTQGSSPAIHDLAAIPRGADATVGYLDQNGVVHYQGQTGRLPGDPATVTQFHDFRGGWVVARDLKITQYDQNGNVVRTGANNGIKVSSDRVTVAWQSGRTVFYGPDNTMGNGGPTQATAPAGESIIGFLPYGPALAGDGNKITTMDNAGRFVTQTVGLIATTTSQSANLVGGLTGSVAKSTLAGGVYDMAAHTLLWSGPWRPVSFSDDGKYVAAFPVAHNGDVGTWAILDARTGKVIARTPKLRKVYLGYTPAWQDDDTLTFTGATLTQSALLTLKTDGTFSRASDIVPTKYTKSPFVFEAQP
ncbi:hypothetical protein [Nocardioides terrisoli]|uniref:hypothetical protein n=1 Tax=Nocardioides terrisoli TaxID=3388267 RepID=UPI00287B7E4A|nr:hypothetical protein [Nocardioides marmorisolisilvae]